jgi:acyl-homoserine lactone acylase PvdQ
VRRRLLAVPAAAVLSLALAAPGASAAAPDLGQYSRGGAVLNILPPGSNGNVDLPALAELGVTKVPSLVSTPSDPKAALATADADTPPHYADQLEMYDALGKTAPGQLTLADLTKYYKDARLGVDPADVVSTETPRPGVVIKRDRFGVPHITGKTFADVEFGAGYANIEDRMFLTDILRHTGAARMAEFVGPTPANVHMDQEQLRIAPYTTAQAQAQVAAVVTRYGAEGQRLLTGLDGMIDGMNAAQVALCPASVPLPLPGTSIGTGAGSRCPVEYAALQKAPTPYTRADIVYIASLVGGIFGKGGGGEDANARWYQQLLVKYGNDAAKARAVYDDLREKNDPEAPTTSLTPVAYGGGGIAPDRPGVALPDLNPTATAPGTGSDAGGSTGPVPLPFPVPLAKPSFGVVDGPLGPMDLGLKAHGMSNALLVDAAHSTDGHPTVVFGPQTGYFAPQLLVEQDLDGPGVKARGVSFAGTNLVVELGHGVDYAWSATSASNDIVDTIAERLCNRNGSAATVESTDYLVGTQCVAMEQYTHSETGVPNPAAPGAPQTYNFLVLKTRHGIVESRTTVAGKPVALVTARTTYGHEVDSVVGFARLQDPDYVKDAASFQRAVSAIDYTFNWFYTDSRDISYFSSGLLPRRASGYDWDLPHWGDPAYDDNGSLPMSAHVRGTNPPQGYYVSWNNKPAPAFSAADNGWGYGPVYRSLALEDRVKARIANGGKVDRPSLVDAMMDGGTVDVRGAYALPYVLDVVGTPSDPQDAEAAALLRVWVADGAHRVDRARTGSYRHAAAIDLLDVWWDPQGAGVDGDFSLPKDVLRGTLGDDVDLLPKGVDDHPRQGLGSAWNGVAWYGYVSKDLRSALGRDVAGAYSRTYCGGGTLAGCRADLLASLHAAVAAAKQAQDVDDVSALTYDKSQDDIRHTAAGVVGVRPIDWQNRPTFQQVVHFTAHRPGTVTAPSAPATPAAPAPGSGTGSGSGSRPVANGSTSGGSALAATGSGALLPLLALGLLAAAGVAARRRGHTEPVC